ncbi:YchJ family metal-binding protein [Roseibium sp. HPY-6]|uniref:YchJ family protein n=1 Tax=Roseibium sp. HPY-6 TaxID=3229852 RepID=UPI0033904680
MDNQACPCGRGPAFEACCEPFLAGSALPKTAEDLMRSRYTAFARQRISYLKDTLWPKHQSSFDELATSRWASENHWAALTVLEVHAGGEADREGTVLFEAKYLSGGKLVTHRERSRFRKKSGRWFYVEAIAD